jgi:hypothetical protein
MKKCDICDEKIERCDDCGEKFSKGDTIFCGSQIGREHLCSNCSYEEGEVI